MRTVHESDISHLEWLVKSRSENQDLALKLYRILRDNGEILRNSDDMANISQGLLAVIFSLWRAVFLSEENNDPMSWYDHVEMFLDTLIRDNEINYTQDKRYQSWTFTYYVANARYRLDAISKKHQEVIIPDSAISEWRESKADWNYLHSVVKQATSNFEKLLKVKS